jgi:tripartite-type tricarboxylate transporter receptor subunit TctC
LLPQNHASQIFRAALIGAALLPLTAASADWKPASNVEVVIPSGPGSGLDRTGRTLQRFMQESKLLLVSSTVVNKARGGAAWLTSISTSIRATRTISRSPRLE